jgi:hypothetical protein
VFQTRHQYQVFLFPDQVYSAHLSNLLQIPDQHRLGFFICIMQMVSTLSCLALSIKPQVFITMMLPSSCSLGLMRYLLAIGLELTHQHLAIIDVF